VPAVPALLLSDGKEQNMDQKKPVNPVVAKLEAFGQELPDQERRVLDWLIERSSSANLPDPSELDLGDLATAAGGAPLSQQLADQFGLNHDSITVMWSRSFDDSDPS
jgi:hypothetical protein